MAGAENGESGKNTVDVAKEEIKQKIKDAKQTGGQELSNLVTDLLDKIRGAKTPAIEVVRITEQIQGKLIPDPIRREAKQVTTAVVKALQGVKEGIIKTVPANSQLVLSKLADQSLSEGTACSLYKIVEKYLVKEMTFSGSGAWQTETEFERDFKELVDQNPIAALLLRNSLFELAKDGKISLTEEQAIKKFSVVEKEQDEESKDKLSYDQKNRYEELSKKINNALSNNLKKDQNDPNKLSGDERFSITKYYFGSDEDLDKMGDALKKLGIESDEMIEYKDLFKKIYRSTKPENLMVFLTNERLRNLLRGACNNFSIYQLEKEGIIKFENPEAKNNQDKGNIINFDKRKFKKMITKYHFQALEPIHDNHSQLYDQAMSMSASQYQYYFGGLQGVIENLCDNLIGNFQNHPDMYNFLKDVRGRYQGTILTYAQTFHNLPLYAKDVSTFEKWPQFLGQLFPSELAEVFDPEDRLMEMMRQEVAMHLRRRIVFNNNRIPADLFSGDYDEIGVRYGIKDMDDMEKTLQARVESRGEKLEPWEYIRARTYAIGIGLASLVDPEIVSTADPQYEADFKGIMPIVSIISAKHNWGMGRGYPKSGLSPHLMAMNVTLLPEQRGFLSRIVKRKSWIPAKFDKYARGQEAKYGERVFNELIDRDHRYQELLNMINIASSLNSRAGWRTSPLIKHLESLVKDGRVDSNGQIRYSIPGENDLSINKDNSVRIKNGWGIDEWNKFFDLTLGIYGNSSLWWQADDRIDSELKRYLAQKLSSKGQLHDDKITNYEYEKYSTGEHAIKREEEIEIEDKKQKFTFAELRMMKTYQVRGEAFYRYLHRNPGDFLMLLSQLSPDLLNNKVNYFYSDEKDFIEKNITGNEDFAKKTHAEITIEVEKWKRIKELWGDKSFATMEQIRHWLFGKDGKAGLMIYLGKEVDGKVLKTKEDVITYFCKQSGNAFENMLRDTDKIDKEKGLPIRSRIEIKEDDFVDKTLGKLVFGEGGLFNILKKEDFGGFDKNGKFSIGKLGFFYHMGETWTLNQANVNPFAPDMNHFAVYKNLGKVGEEVIMRYLGDTQAVSKIIGELSHLDDKLQHAAQSRDLKEIFEIHKAVWTTLKNVMGLEYANRANYIMAQIVAQYFYEHSDTRIPFLRSPFNLPLKWLLGKKIALSKIVGYDIHAMSWDQNGVRDYFRRLGHELHVIPTEGLWSIEQLDSAFDAKTDTFIVGDIGPSFLYYMIMFLLWSYVKKAMEEAEGKKK